MPICTSNLTNALKLTTYLTKHAQHTKLVFFVRKMFWGNGHSFESAQTSQLRGPCWTLFLKLFPFLLFFNCFQTLIGTDTTERTLAAAISAVLMKQHD